MSISCSPWAADGCLVHTSCRSRFSHLFGRAQPLMMRDARASIMNVSCSPSSLASLPFQHRREFLAFLGQRSAPNVACIVQSAFLAVFTALSMFSFRFPRPGASIMSISCFPWASCRSRFARCFGRGTGITSISCSPWVPMSVPARQPVPPHVLHAWPRAFRCIQLVCSLIPVTTDCHGKAVQQHDDSQMAYEKEKKENQKRNREV